MNRVLFTSIICSVACNELPSDSQLSGVDNPAEETMMMVEGSIEQQSQKQSTVSNPKGLSTPSVLNDHSMSLQVGNAEPASENGLDSYFEKDDVFSKQLYAFSKSMELSNAELRELINLETQMNCDPANALFGELQLEDNNQRGTFEMIVFELESEEKVDFLEGKVYLGKSTGIMMDSDDTMIASLENANSTSNVWDLARGLGSWKVDDTKGERFFIVLDTNQIVGFETECD